jgi:hypothetical protein
MHPLAILGLVVGGTVVVAKVFSSDEPRPVTSTSYKRATVVSIPSVFSSDKMEAMLAPAQKATAVSTNATPEEMAKAFAAAAARSTTQREAQFKQNRAYATAQMTEWGKWVPILGTLAGVLAGALTWGAATIGNAVADFLGLYDNDWNSDENQLRAQNDVQKILQWGLVPDSFHGELHAGASGYADDLEANTIAPMQSLGPDFLNKWKTFIAWYTADTYRPVVLDSQLIRDTNGKPFFPATFNGLTGSRSAVMVLGRLVSASKGRDPSLGMAAAAKTYDAWTREDRMFLDRAAKRLSAIFYAAWNA